MSHSLAISVVPEIQLSATNGACPVVTHKKLRSPRMETEVSSTLSHPSFRQGIAMVPVNSARCRAFPRVYKVTEPRDNLVRDWNK